VVLVLEWRLQVLLNTTQEGFMVVRRAVAETRTTLSLSALATQATTVVQGHLVAIHQTVKAVEAVLAQLAETALARLVEMVVQVTTLPLGVVKQQQRPTTVAAAVAEVRLAELVV
jgi:hypothetical protein